MPFGVGRPLFEFDRLRICHLSTPGQPVTRRQPHGPCNLRTVKRPCGGRHVTQGGWWLDGSCRCSLRGTRFRRHGRRRFRSTSESGDIRGSGGVIPCLR
jgi:hypothetical protein